jgi:hypothetical protein
MLKFIRGKGGHTNAERVKLQKELFAFNKVRYFLYIILCNKKSHCYLLFNNSFYILKLINPSNNIIHFLRSNKFFIDKDYNNL